MTRRDVIPLVAAILLLAPFARADAPADQLARGEKIYAEKCLICHQAAGQGAPPVYPPLAASDWLLADRERAIKVLCEGLSGTIVVNGQSYTNIMPAQVLDDRQAADVMTFITNSWGNEDEPFTADEVAAARRKSRFKTFDALVHATAFQPLPKPPAGWRVRELVELPEFCTRLASDGSGRLVFALTQKGGVYALEPASPALVPILKGADYIDVERGDHVALGLTVGPDGRLWLVTNQKLTKGVPIYTNEVVIWRSTEPAKAEPIKVEPWFKTTYPHGVGGMNHGVSHLAFGPDGRLYVASGSRTDAGEGSEDPKFFKGGEVETTACLWRFDPRAAKPQIEVIARGLRNPYGFAWDGSGNLFTASNGPDANAAEELDFIQPGRHYGFPYQFADSPAKAGHPYKHTPPAPPGLDFTMPVRNVGPAAGGHPAKPMATFDPHSSPGGIIWCGDDFPEPLRRRFLITRFGNLLGPPASPEDVGFDVVSAHLEKQDDGSWKARVETVLAPLGRPLDVHAIGGGRALVLEYTRPTNFKEGLGWLPGRIIELAPETQAR